MTAAAVEQAAPAGASLLADAAANAEIDESRRALTTASMMLAALLVMLDSTVANVALPHIQSSISASPEQIIWVVTSYVIAGAIATPLSGWLAMRFGRKLVMVASIGGFTLTSIACGLANDLPSLVLFRLLQGATGAAMVPLSQATLLDIYPPEKHGKAMALYGMGAMLGGIIGPTLGGSLTEWMSWRAVFLINVPFGSLACLGLWLFMPSSPAQRGARFDLFGFAALSVFLASLQLIVDRGQQLDWFDSTEIRIEAGVAAGFGYIFLVHMFTASAPFIRPALFRDRNFAAGAVITAATSVQIFGALPLIGIMLQNLFRYPVMLAGLVLAPRGVATMVAMTLTGGLIGRIDTRVLVMLGLIATAGGFYLMSGLSLQSTTLDMTLCGLFTAIGSGIIFVPLTTLTFSTLASELRDEGTAVSALVRNISSSVGVSMLQVMTLRNAAIVQARLSEKVRPDNPVFAWRLPDFDFQEPLAIAEMQGVVARQALMVGYTDAFWLMFLLSLAMLPVMLLMRTPRRPAQANPGAVDDEEDEEIRARALDELQQATGVSDNAAKNPVTGPELEYRRPKEPVLQK
jgi:DHA2 family multidrug resistance protein